MNRNLGLSLARVTEIAAIEASKWLGRGEKNAADQAAVNGMRRMFDTVDIDGVVVIGEGEKDEAPMLYIGESIGTQAPDSTKVDIAVDPLDGTTSTAKGLSNAISVIAVAPRGTLYTTHFYYMDKIAVGPKAKGVIDLAKPLKQNLSAVAEALDKSIKDLTVTMLERDRHHEYIKQCRDLGCRIKLFRDGDVGGSIATCIEDSGVDVLVGIGGSPEGVLAAAAIKCLGGEIQCRLFPYTLEERSTATPEDYSTILHIDDLVKTDEALFVATGVSDGDLLRGVRFMSEYKLRTHTIVMRAKSGTIRYIDTVHDTKKKPEYALGKFER